jgi:hypothetical protein
LRANCVGLGRGFALEDDGEDVRGAFDDDSKWRLGEGRDTRGGRNSRGEQGRPRNSLRQVSVT